MSEFPRRIALEAVQRLLDGQTSAGSCVFVDRIDALPDETMRAITINVISARLAEDEEAFDSATHIADVAVTAVATTSDALDDLSYEIEGAMAAGFGTIHRGLTGIVFDQSADGADSYFIAAMTYAVVYKLGQTPQSF